MAGGIFAVLDDIAMLMDDTAAITKLSIKKTVPILGDDLAVNAQKASDFAASRELPVLLAITKGSLKNKVIILPFAFLLSAFLPWIIPYILIIGGLYLAYEGVEKIHEIILEKLFNKHHSSKKAVMTEEQKIKSAILTDFILSIEIVMMALGAVIEEALPMQILAVTAVAIIATIGVYGIVAILVRMDDMGLYLIENANENKIKISIGNILISSLPIVIKVLGFVGTIAMLLVAGGIFVHNIHFIHDLAHSIEFLPIMLFESIVAFIVGYIVVASISFYNHLTKNSES